MAGRRRLFVVREGQVSAVGGQLAGAVGWQAGDDVDDEQSMRVGWRAVDGE